jgi:hypothetical protein
VAKLSLALKLGSQVQLGNQEILARSALNLAQVYQNTPF